MYRKGGNRKIHPKIFIWAHTKKAEIEYFQDFKNYLRASLLTPRKNICPTPQELLRKVIKWKKMEICEKDGDQVWCIFDVDDFYEGNKTALITAVKNAQKNNIRIAYANECFELWILLHLQKVTVPVERGKALEEKIQGKFKKYKLGRFVKNQKVFDILLPFQNKALENSKKILPEYDRINWEDKLSKEGNPSTSIHFLVDEINALYKD